MKRIAFAVNIIAIVGVIAAVGTARAATMATNYAPPAVDGEDIANLVAGTHTDKWWAEVSGAGKAMGQTFTTGGSNVSFNAVTYRVGINNNAEPTKHYKLRVGVIDKPNPSDSSTWVFYQVYSEMATQTMSWATNQYMTWTFDNPPVLYSNTVYGIDIGMTYSSSGWQSGIPYLQYNNTGTYADGERYLSPGSSNPTSAGLGDETMGTGHDRVFHLDMTATNAVDATAPTITSIGDDVYGGPIWENITPVTYTLYFDEDIDESTVDTSDFENAGTGVSFTVGAITKITPVNAPAQVAVVVNPTGTGTLQLQVKPGAVIADKSGNPLDTTSAIADDTAITVNAGSAPATVIAGTAGGNDSWNVDANWTISRPFGNFAAVISNGVTAAVDNNTGTPVYSGGLTISSNATLRVGYGNPVLSEELNALGTGTITMHEGSRIILRYQAAVTMSQPLALQGAAQINGTDSTTAHHQTRTFSGPISGPGSLTLWSGNNNTFIVDSASNTFSGGITVMNANCHLAANADGALGTGNVYIEDATSLVIGGALTNAIDDSAQLHLNGAKDSGQTAKLVLNSSETVYQLWMDGVQHPGGDYTSTEDWISGGGTLTVLTSPASITNNTAVNVEETTADLTGTLDGLQAQFGVSVYWGTNDNADSTAWLADDSASAMVVGTYSNVAGYSVTGSVSSLAPGTTYYYTMVASNALITIWASPNASFVTPAPPAMPIVSTAGGATDIDIGMSTLNGELTAGGSADAYICWGESDGGTTSTDDWQHVVPMGSVIQSVPFSTDLTGLLYGIEYDYRVYATNANGEAWSAAATFMTPLPQQGGDAVGWSYTNWTGDADSGITDAHIYTAAHCFGDNHAGSVSVNGVAFTESFAASGSGWSIGGGQNNWNGDDNGNITGGSEDLAEEFVYNGNPRTVQFTGLTIGSRYKTTFFSVAWEAADRFQTFLSDGDSLSVDQDTFGDNNGITISYVYDAADTAQDFSITPVGGGTFHMYALANREEPVPVTVGIANTGAMNIGATTANLAGTLDATQSVFNVTVYWSTNDNVDAAAWLADGTASQMAIGSYTNVAGLSVTGSVSELAGGVTYYYTMVASNAATNIWASPNVSFGTIALPVVDNAGGATDVQGFTATLNGVLTVGGLAQAYICWGTNDAGISSTGVWDSVVSVGEVAQGEPFSTGISGLTPDTDYAYRCYVVNVAGSGWSTNVNFTTTDPVNTMVNNAASTAHNSWNLDSNWTQGHVPTGVEVAVITNGLLAEVEDDAATPVYSGGLILEEGAGLQIGWDNPQEAAELNALGTGSWTMNAGSYIWIRYSNSSTHANPITLLGDAEFATGKSTAAHNDQRTLTGVISGPGKLTVHTTNGNILHINPSDPGGNTWSGGLLAGGVHSENKKETIEAEKTGALGTGNVTIDGGVTLQIDADDAMGDAATLNLAGNPRSDSTYKLVLNADDTVDMLTIDGFPYPVGTYGKVGSGASNEFAWINGNGILTVTNAPADSAPPTVTLADDQGGGAVYPGQPVTYTITFTEPHTPALSSNDLENATGTGMTIESVTSVRDGLTVLEYQVVVKATGTGTLQLQVKSGTTVKDLFGNALVTPVADDNTLTVQDLPSWKGELGVLKPWANGGINPATGSPWAVGDTYHLAFVTSGTRDATDPGIAPYRAFVQSAAADVGWGDATWYCVLQTWDDPARDVNAPPMTTSSAIVLADGETMLADDGPDLANGPDHTFSITEIGTSYSGAVASGSNRKPGDPNQSRIEHGVSWATDGRWWQQYNGNQSSQWHFYAISDPLKIQSGIPPAPPGTLILVQ